MYVTGCGGSTELRGGRSNGGRIVRIVTASPRLEALSEADLHNSASRHALNRKLPLLGTSAWMRFFVSRTQITRAEVRVDLGGDQTFVAEQFLYAADVCAAIE